MLTAERRAAILARIEKIPIVETLNVEVVSLGDGTCELKVPYKHAYDGVFESFHGGLVMTVADSAACFAAFTLTGAEMHMTTTDMNIRFLAPCLTDLVAKAKVIKLGRTLCPAHVDLFDTNGTQVAVAQIGYFLLDRIPHRSK